MAEFVRAQIFGTTFEITSRYSTEQSTGGDIQLIMRQLHRSAARRHGRLWSRLVLSPLPPHPVEEPRAYHPSSSAKDQLTGQAVAVKKIMKPFSTPVLSKRTYRELKLLKHIRHENASLARYLG